MKKEEIREKVRALMADMTTEEKVLQLTCLMLDSLADPEKLGIENGIGTIPVMGGAPNEIAENIAKIQSYVLEHSRHKIPVLFHCEALAGTFIGGGAQFPLPVAMGATFNPELVQKMAELNAAQMRASGIRQALSPVVDVARDLRWGRLGETYGGDPVLCGAMGTAYVRGMQNKDGANNASTLKHFLGYSATSGALNMAQTVVTKRDLRENFARPFEMAIRDGGVRGVMSSYSEYDGKPVCASKEILTDLLRDDLGFDGVVVSDYASVERLTNVFGLTDDITEAAEMCLKAGMDMELPQPVGYTAKMAADADSGNFDMAYIDRAVERVLTLKYELGLFENPFPDAAQMAAAFGNPESSTASREAARQAMTLTKNESLLPLTDRSKKIAVIGPMGSTARAFYGGYTLIGGLEMAMSGSNAMAGVSETQMDVGRELDLHITDPMLGMIYPDAKSTLQALQSRFENVTYAQGCDYAAEDCSGFAAAIEAAKDADIVVMTLGGRNGWGSYCTSGEGVDTTDIGLPGCQEELLRAVFEVNPNMILVHTDCRPVVSPWIYDHVPAILEAWLPCTYGGDAIAETLTGENNPGGRLNMDVPRSTGHTPVVHNGYRGTEPASFRKGAIIKQGYYNADMTAQLPFGHGLSYTTFDYSDFHMDMDANEQVTISVTVTNTGKCRGDEVVQLYGVDPIASVIRPAEELVGFRRITLEPGQSKVVTFTFNIDILAFYDEPNHWIVEKGDFTFYVGRNSKEPIFSGTVSLPKTHEVNHRTRCLIAKAEC